MRLVLRKDNMSLMSMQKVGAQDIGRRWALKLAKGFEFHPSNTILKEGIKKKES